MRQSVFLEFIVIVLADIIIHSRLIKRRRKKKGGREGVSCVFLRIHVLIIRQTTSKVSSILFIIYYTWKESREKVRRFEASRGI